MCTTSSADDSPGRLPALQVWQDPVHRPGSAQMAVDELLFLSRPRLPVLRLYRWPPNTTSFGYSASWDTVRPALAPDLDEIIRRWTGGGIVPHGDDLTYTLVLPPGDGPWGRSLDVYLRTHSAVVAALAEAGTMACLAREGAGPPGSPCFVRPARHDVMVGPRKVAGAGQRRTRHGILHQGSLRDEAAFVEIVLDMAARLADRLVPFPSSAIPDESTIQALARRRYAHPAWTSSRKDAD